MVAPRSVRSVAVALAALLAVLLAPAPAGAVISGEPDAGRHPYVGVAYAVETYCSGALIAPTVFLTAGHCTARLEADGTQVYVTFAEAPVVDPDLTHPWFFPDVNEAVTGTPVTHGDFNWEAWPDTADVGVIILDQAVDWLGVGALPELGQLDPLATRRGRQDRTFAFVGYGSEGASHAGGVAHDLAYSPRRMVATAQLIGINKNKNATGGSLIELTNAPGTGGGQCFGDSGGPTYLGDAHLIVGVNSAGRNELCTGNHWAYRLDTATAYAFLCQFESYGVVLPSGCPPDDAVAKAAGDAPAKTPVPEPTTVPVPTEAPAVPTEPAPPAEPTLPAEPTEAVSPAEPTPSEA